MSLYREPAFFLLFTGKMTEQTSMSAPREALTGSKKSTPVVERTTTQGLPMEFVAYFVRFQEMSIFTRGTL